MQILCTSCRVRFSGMVESGVIVIGVLCDSFQKFDSGLVIGGTGIKPGSFIT